MKEEIENEINEKKTKRDRALKRDRLEQAVSCSVALTQLYDFLEKIEELEKLI